MSRIKKNDSRKYFKLYELAKKYNGVLMPDNPEVVTLLNGGDTIYRFASYIYDIKKYLKVEVKTVRSGRRVLAYEIPALQALSVPTEIATTTAAVVENGEHAV